MSFIRMSSSLTNMGTKRGLFAYAGESYSYPEKIGLFRIYGGVYCLLSLYSGTVPTSSALSSYNGFPSDYSSGQRLISFGPMGGNSQYDEIVTSNSKVYVKSKTTKNANANASGTAGWFMWYNLYPYDSLNYMNSTGMVVVGDVTGVGGGGALEMDDVDIVNGRNYQLRDYSFVIPRQWTF